MTATETSAAALATPKIDAKPGDPLSVRARAWGRLIAPPLGVFAIIVALWYIVHKAMGTNGYLLPTPVQIFKGAFVDSAARSTLLSGLWHTTLVALTGLVIAAAIGMTWATFMALARWFERSTYPYAVILQTIPILAIVPLIGIWFGYDFPARVVVCVIIALFPMVANTLFGLKSVDKLQLELFQLQKASGFTVLSKLMFPAAMPAIFLGLRTSAGLAVVGALVGDYFFQQGEAGLGGNLLIYTRLLQMEPLFGAIFLAAMLGVIMFVAFGMLSKAVVGKWYEAAG